MKILNIHGWRISWRGFLLLALLGFLFFYNFSIIQKERLLDRGRPVILKLAPLDPRSLMQGDYMVLSFGIERPISKALRDRDGNKGSHFGKGRAILREHDGEHIFARLDDGKPLLPGERFLNYKIAGYNSIKIGGASFFFEEGLANLYDQARYALVRVDEDGKGIITELLDDRKKALNKDRWNAKTGSLRED